MEGVFSADHQCALVLGRELPVSGLGNISQLEGRTFKALVSPASVQCAARLRAESSIFGSVPSITNPPRDGSGFTGKVHALAFLVLNVQRKAVRNFSRKHQRSVIGFQCKRWIPQRSTPASAQPGLSTGSAAGFTGGKATTSTDFGL